MTFLQFSENGGLHSVWNKVAGARSLISGSPTSTALPAFIQSAASDSSNIVLRASLFFGCSSNGEIGAHRARISFALRAADESPWKASTISCISAGQQRNRSGWYSANEVQWRIDGDLIGCGKAVPVLEMRFAADRLRCFSTLSRTSVDCVLAKGAPEIFPVRRPVLEFTQEQSVDE
jgi:hypothetical protein